MSAWTRLWANPSQRLRVAGAEPAPGPRLHVRGLSAEVPSARIVFINQYYWPDHASTAQHLTDLAEALAEAGHDVHVVCSRGGYRPGRPARPVREVHNGVTIHRASATALGRRSMLHRYADYLSFYVLAFWIALRLPRFDVVVTLTTPPIIGLIGTMLRRFKKSRHVYWSMDLHPDASMALGKMRKSSPVVKLLAWISDAVYRAADRVVVLGPYMADRIAAKGAKPARIEMVPVWSRRDEIYPLPREGHPLRAELGLADSFVIMYSGNLGLAHSFEEFLDAARLLRERRDIVFLFVGEGPRLSEVRTAREREGLENVRLLDYFPREQLHASLSVADVHLISMRPEMTGIVVPGKLYGAMASGRPTIFVGPAHCESADTIREAGCGFTVRQGDADGLVAAITQLAANPDLASEMGERGRMAFLEEHERDACCERWGEVIGGLIAAPASAAETVPEEGRDAALQPTRPFDSALKRPGMLGRRAGPSSLPAAQSNPTLETTRIAS